MYFPQFGLKVNYEPGDILFFRARVIIHGLENFDCEFPICFWLVSSLLSNGIALRGTTWFGGILSRGFSHQPYCGSGF